MERFMEFTMAAIFGLAFYCYYLCCTATTPNLADYMGLFFITAITGMTFAVTTRAILDPEG
jgi:hypothetical protein